MSASPHYAFPPARAYPLNRALFALKSDPAFRQRFLEAPEAALTGLALSPEEMAALKARDVAGLARLGAHPYLAFMAVYRLGMEQERESFEYY